MALDQILYTAKATVAGGREGSAKSDDGRLDVDLSVPKSLGGDDGQGTNPEQLFAAGYAACFTGALRKVAAEQKVKLPRDISITGEVAIGPKGAGFSIAAKLTIDLGDMDKEQARAIVDAAHQVCPYSNATRGNIDVELALA
ncbi:organic hydroperoxide resistance protein [Amphritea sp.]|uniref:organic hydroperoxide resistance protein n=1 Tax=Amphritea sp. TaxID=1872502 RepID=UPI003D0EDA69